MSAGGVRRSIDAAVAELLAPLLAATPGPTQWRLVGWDCEAGITLTLARGDAALLVELDARDDARDCYARTERFNVCARRAFDAHNPLGGEERRAVDRLVELVRTREDGLATFERPATSGRAAVRVIGVDRVLVPEGAGHYYINPYVGCMIGCEFCYAAERADFSRSLEGLPRLPWGRWVDVKVDAPAVLSREVREHPPGIVRLSPIVTDPYQPIERKYRVTRQCLEVLLEAGFAPVVLTRSALVLDDLELLRRFPRAAVGLSIPTDDDAVRQRFEPGGDPIDERLDALARCHDAGLRTFAVVQPVLPMDAARLVERLAPHVRAVRIDRMFEIPRVRHLYERAAMLEAATDAFFERTSAALRAGFAARGVALDAMDDLGAVLDIAPLGSR